MYKKRINCKSLSFTLRVCILLMAMLSVIIINGFTVLAESEVSQPATTVREIIKGTLTGKTESNCYNLMLRNGKTVALTGNTNNMEYDVGKDISVVGYYDNMNRFYTETFVLQREGNHEIISERIGYFCDPTIPEGETRNVQGNAVIAYSSNYIKYFKANVVTETNNYEISLVDQLSTTDNKVLVGLFKIYSGGELVEKLVKGSLYQLYPNSDGYFKFYSDGEIGKQWCIVGYFSARYDYGIEPSYSPVPPIPTSTSTPTSTSISTPIPVNATANPLLGKNIKIQLTSNNFDYVYYYFNKISDSAEGRKIGLTTRADFENGEIFSVEYGGNGTVFLKAISPDGNVDGYLSVDSENRVVINTSLEPAETERFELNYQTWSGNFTLKSAYNGKFVCADVFSGYSVTADRDVADVWETFKANILPPTSPSIANRPTPSVKQTPGPTELDAIYKVSGSIITKNNSNEKPLNNCSIEFMGTEMSQTGSDFSFDTCYSCGSLRISRPGYLSREVQVEKFIYGSKSVELFAGDINQDNAINMSDIMEIAKSYNSIKGDEVYNAICDLNEDTVINMIDIMMVACHFNKTSSDYIKLADNLSVSEHKLEFTVEPAIEISKDSAGIKGAIYNMSYLRCVTPVWIEYWEESDPHNVKTTSSDIIFYYPDFIARTITCLKPGTTYKYRVKSGVGLSEIKSFTTLTDKLETK